MWIANARGKTEGRKVSNDWNIWDKAGEVDTGQTLLEFINIKYFEIHLGMMGVFKLETDIIKLVFY